MTVHPEFVALYETQPYGVAALPYDPKQPASFAALRQQKGFDLALIPGDNRYSWLARALEARWIVAFAGDWPPYKSWAVDAFIPFPQNTSSVGDMMALLADGAAPAPYRQNDWPAPTYAAFDLPHVPYAVLHVGAGNVLRRWEAEKWRALIVELEARGLRCVFSGAASDREHIARIDPEGARLSYAGNTSLAQLWHLLQNAALLVCPDTGIAHLGRIVGVPTVAIYGQGSPLLFGAGAFWRDAPFQAVWLPDFPCRDQKVLFKREAEWIRRCSRTSRECSEARCMQGIDVAPVLDAIDRLLNNARP
jgi:ADP-heptose:LPS heptosyltransferase